MCLLIIWQWYIKLYGNKLNINFMLTGNNLSKTPCFWFVKPFFYFVLTSDLFFMPAESQALMRGNYTDPAATHYWVSRNLSMHWWKYWNARKVLPWEEAWLNSIIYRRTVFDCNLTHINAVMTFLLSSFSFNFNWVSSKSILSSLYQSLLFSISELSLFNATWYFMKI